MDTNNTVTDKEARRRWVILGVSYVSILAFAITLQSVPPVLSLVMSDLNLSHAQGGLLMSLFALPGIIISIPAGMLADRYGQKVIGLVSFVFMITGVLIFVSANSLLVMGLGRAVTGIGAITISVLIPQLLAQWFAGREIGTAMGLFNTGVPLGTFLSLNFLSRIGESFGWRTSIWISIAPPLVALIVFALFFTPVLRKTQVTSPRSEGILLDVRRAGTSSWLVGVAWMLFNASLISLFTFTPDLLKGSGFSVTSAGFISSAVMLPALILSPFVGYVIDKIGRKRTIITIGSLGLTGLIMLVPTATSWMLLLMLCIGVVQAMVPTPIFALLPEVTSPERLGVSFGIISTCLNLGIMMGPAAAGFMRYATGSYQASYALMAGLAFLIPMVMLQLRHR